MSKNTFDNLFIIGRPAGGKSEFIDFTKKYPTEKRVERFHINNFVEVDDFVWLWDLFEQDNIWEEAIGKRFLSTYEGTNIGLTDGNAFKYLDVKLAKEAQNYLNDKKFYNENTLFLECARGGDFPFADTFSRFSKEVLEKSAILYISCSYSESIRRNNARYEEKMKASILAHKAADFVMEKFYKDNDWSSLTESKSSGHLTLNETQVPFVTMDNENESTDFNILEERYGTALNHLFELYKK